MKSLNYLIILFLPVAALGSRGNGKVIDCEYEDTLCRHDFVTPHEYKGVPELTCGWVFNDVTTAATANRTLPADGFTYVPIKIDAPLWAIRSAWLPHPVNVEWTAEHKVLTCMITYLDQTSISNMRARNYVNLVAPKTLDYSCAVGDKKKLPLPINIQSANPTWVELRLTRSERGLSKVEKPDGKAWDSNEPLFITSPNEIVLNVVPSCTNAGENIDSVTVSATIQ